MTPDSVSVLIHIVGFLSAAALFGLLLAMALPGRGRPLRDGATLGGRVVLPTALLGLLWNLAELAPLLGLPSSLARSPWLVVPALTAFGLLPAVFVQTALPWPEGRGRRRAVRAARAAAFALSGLAGLLHVRQALGDGRLPSSLALDLLAWGFLALVPVLAYLTPPGQRLQSGLVAAGALLVFSVSALHLGQHAATEADTLSSALLGHHASLPLVLAILFLDYRFALADLFLKRALSLLALAALVVGAFVGVVAPLLRRRGPEGALDAPAVAALLLAWSATVLLYPRLRRAAEGLVDAVILRRPDYGALRDRIAAELAGCDNGDDALDLVRRRLGPALSARHVSVEVEAGQGPPAASGVAPGRSARVPVPTAEPPHHVLRVDDLAGGRRLLSDDLRLLESVAALAGRRLDALRLTHERFERDLREREIAKLASEAELRALRAQLDPHFLFNALTSIGYLLGAAPDKALRALLDLTQLLRAVLKRSRGDFVPLGHEIDLVESYLAIEGVRFEERLRARIDVPEELRALEVPPLVVQPLVENAIKHGISPLIRGGEVTVRARLDGAASGARRLCIVVSDTGRGTDAPLGPGACAADGTGLGLDNVRRRLAAYFGAQAELRFASRAGAGTDVTLLLPADARGRAGRPAPARGALETLP